MFNFGFVRSYQVRTPVRNSDNLSVFPGCRYDIEQPSANEILIYKYRMNYVGCKSKSIVQSRTGHEGAEG